MHPLTARSERDWERLAEWVMLAPDYFLIFVFTDDRRAVAVLRARFEAFLATHERRSHVVVCDAPGELVSRGLPALVDTPAEATVWIEGMGAETRWHRGWDEAARRWNERRELLLRARTGGMVVCAPAWARPVIREAAPDLWSFASMFAFPACETASLGADGPYRTYTPRVPEGTAAEKRLARAQAKRALALEADASTRRAALVSAARSLLDAGIRAEAESVVDAAMEAHAAAGLPDTKSGSSPEVLRAAVATVGHLADVLYDLWRTDDALRICRDDLLPVLNELGDVHELAVTMLNMAGILQLRGQTDEGLSMLRESVLPVFERLGDVRHRAIAMMRVADLLQERGDTEEALQILRERVLHDVQRLVDERLRAVSMGMIASILTKRGDTEEALRILHEDALPAFERLGDQRSRAIAMGVVAEILQQRGATDEALRILREEQLPVFERLGDVRERADTIGKIADLHLQRGEAEEALRLVTEEYLPAAVRIEDADLEASARMLLVHIGLAAWPTTDADLTQMCNDVSKSLTLTVAAQRAGRLWSACESLVQLLTAAHRADEARRLLDEAVVTFDRLGATKEADLARAYTTP